MTKKELQKLAQQKIKEGKTRQETFDEIRSESKNKSEDIAKAVRFIPTLENRKKYKVPQIILLVTLGITIVLKTLGALPIVMEKGINFLPVVFLVPIFNIIIAYGVATYKGQFYRLVGIFAIISLVRQLTAVTEMGYHPIYFLELGIILLLVIMGSYLNSKLVSNFKTEKEKYTSPEGKPRLRNKIVFED